MIKLYYLFITFVLLLFTQCSEKTTYKVGQEWSYKTRQGEENSTLKILKIEEYPKEEQVIHISIDQIKMENPHSKEGIVEELSHIPISKEALDMSVTNLKNEKSQLPDFNDGYNYWKKEFDKGNAGVFSISVSEIVSGMEKNLISGDVID